MIASERSAYILRRLEQSGIIDYKNISAELQVSEATVRRDFEKLERAGRLRRVQGGAIQQDEQLIGELSVLTKETVHVEEKLRVAQAAAQEVQDGESIFLDCGTSIAPLGKLLLHKKIHIVTNNSLLLPYASAGIEADLFFLGGKFYPADQMFMGPLTENMLSCFTFHRAFIGCLGLDIGKNAVYETDMGTLAIKQIAMHNSEKNYLLIDASKENKRGLFRLSGVQEFHSIYVNDDGSGREYPEHFIVV